MNLDDYSIARILRLTAEDFSADLMNLRSQKAALEQKANGLAQELIKLKSARGDIPSDMQKMLKEAVGQVEKLTEQMAAKDKAIATANERIAELSRADSVTIDRQQLMVALENEKARAHRAAESVEEAKVQFYALREKASQAALILTEQRTMLKAGGDPIPGLSRQLEEAERLLAMERDR